MTLAACLDCGTVWHAERHKLHLDYLRPVWQDVIEDHTPDIGQDQSDSTWLECSCGWDQSKPRPKRNPHPVTDAPSWDEHIIAAVEAASAAPDPR